MMDEDGKMQEIHYDDVPEATSAVEIADHFKPVKISPRAIDEASKLIPQKFFEQEGLHAYLQKRANWLFSQIGAAHTEGYVRSLKYYFIFDSDGPVLKTVTL